MTLEKVGFIAVIEGFNEYIGHVREMQGEDQKLVAGHKRVEESSAGAASGLGKLAGALAVAAAGYASLSTIEGAIDKTVELGEATYKLQQVTGLEAKEASGLLAAMHSLGIAPEEAIASFGIFARNLTNTVDQLKQGKDVATPFANSLSAFGIKVLDANGNLRPFHQILLDTADAFAKAGPGIDTTARAMDLFGRNGKTMLPILLQGREGIVELEQAADKLGVTLTQDNVNQIYQFVIANREAGEAVAGLKLQLALTLLPVLTTVAQFFSEHAEDIRDYVSKAASAFSDLATYVGQPIANIIAAVQQGEASIADIADFISDLAHGRWGQAWDDLKSVALDVVHTMIIDIAAAFGFLPNIMIDAVNAAIRELNKVKIPEFDIRGHNVIPGAGGGLGLPEIPHIFPTFQLPDLSGSTKQVQDHGKAIQEEGQAAAGAAKADEDLKKAIDDLKKGSLDWADEIKLGLTPVQAGQLEAYVKIKDLTNEVNTASEDYVKSLAMIGEAYNENSDLATQLVLKQAETTRDALNKAEDALFNRPSREMANMTVQLDKFQLAADAVAARIQPMVDGLNDMKDKLNESKDAINAEKDALDEQSRALDKQISALQDAPLIFGAVGPGGPSQQQQDVAKAARDQQVKALEAQKKALDDEQHALDRHIKQIDNDSKAIDNRIKAIQREQVLADRQVKSVEAQLKLETDRQKLLKEEYTQADQTLKTDKEIGHEAETLRDDFHTTTGYIETLSDRLNKNLNPEVDEAYKQFHKLQGEVGLLNDPAHIPDVIDKSFHVAEKFQALITAADAAATHLNQLSLAEPQQSGGGAGTGGGSPRGAIPTVPSLFPPTILTNPLGPGAIPIHDRGGMTDSPTLAMLSANARPELVLPLTDAARSRELLSMLPASLVASMLPHAGGNTYINASAQGATLDDVAVAAHRALDQALSQARTSQRRSSAYTPAGIS